MFGFGRSTKDPLADKKTVERWLASFPASDPLARPAAMLTELGALAERERAAHDAGGWRRYFISTPCASRCAAA